MLGGKAGAFKCLCGDIFSISLSIIALCFLYNYIDLYNNQKQGVAGILDAQTPI